jgi:apolipoprotein N-acyltransferase
MLLENIFAVFTQSFGLTYSWLNENLISPFIAFTRGFEFAVIVMAAVLFFTISVFLLLRQAKKLPKSYTIEIVDVYGRVVSIDGVRQTFATHDAAESYARMYRSNFRHQYRFRVIGVLDPGKS